MWRRRLVLLLTVGALLLTATAPASAHMRGVIRSDMDMTLIAQPCEDGRFLTWAGTTTIDGETYGWADFPTAANKRKGPFMFFEEYWTIFDLGGSEVATKDLACNADLVLMDGENKGMGVPSLFIAFAWGQVTWTSDGGPFDDVPDGSRMLWCGYLPEKRDPIPGDRFVAELRIIARR